MEIEELFAPSFSLAVPHFSDYFGLWAIYEEPFKSAVERCNGINLHAHIKSEEAAEAVSRQMEKEYPVTKDGIAVFNINGPMMKTASSLSGGTSTVYLRQQIRAARKDPEVAGAILIMDTPGGTVKGNKELADEVKAFAAVKPIVQFTDDMTASAGVSVASQATKRYANSPSALYGAMGTYSVLIDSSGRAEQLGIRVHVVRAGASKGAGEPGTQITEEHLAEVQRIINAMNDTYVELIATGLGKSVESIKAIADGRIHPASEALKMGLIDGIKSKDEAYSELVQMISSAKVPVPSPKPRSTTMAETTEKTPASIAELKKTFPKSSADWREKQLEANATIAEAAISYASFLEAKAEETEKAHAKALADAKAKSDEELEAAKGKGKISGGALGQNPVVARGRRNAQPVESNDDEYVESGDPIEDFNAAVAKIAGPNADLTRRQRAIRQVASQNPDLYQSYLLASNSGGKQKRLIQEKLETVIAK